MEQLRLEVRNRTLLLDKRDFVFIAEDGVQVEKTDTEGVVLRVERHVRRKTRGSARVHARTQLLQSLRQFNSPREGYTQFVVVEPSSVERLVGLEETKRQAALDEAVVRGLQTRLPVDLLAIRRWAHDHGLFVGLSGKDQLLGGKARLTTEGMRTDFEPEKLVARSLLDKPDAFRGGTLRLLVLDDFFVNEATGDGAFLLKASAPRECSRVVHQRFRRCLDYRVMDAKRGEVYLRLEFEAKVARHDTEIVSVREDGDLVHIEKRETARIDTGAKLVHERGWKATAIVVDELPAHVPALWPERLDGIANASCVKSNAILAALSHEAMLSDGRRAYLLDLPVRMLFTGEERMSDRGNRISLNVLSTLHTVSPAVMERVVEARVDEGPGAVLHALLWWADALRSVAGENGHGNRFPGLLTRTKADLRADWKDALERRLAFGDLPDHPLFDPAWNPEGFVARGRGGQVVVPSARVLLATLGRVEVEGEHGFFFPDYLNTLLQVVRCLDVRPDRFETVRETLRENVLRAAKAMLDDHSIRVPGLHGVLLAVSGLGATVVVPDRFHGFRGTVHGEPTMNRDGIRSADVVPLREARARGVGGDAARYLIEHLVSEDLHAIVADWDRLTRMNRDNDGDLIYLSRVSAAESELAELDSKAESVSSFVDAGERFDDLSVSFRKLRADHDPFDLSPEIVERAVLETAGSARDVGSITLLKYTVTEALAGEQRWDLFAPVAKIVQSYVDGLKGPHQQSANLFAALMRVWARMSMPCRAVKDGEGKEARIVAVHLAANLRRELLRAGYVEGRDFFGEVAVPHPALAEEAYRKIKAPLVGILEEILANLASQGLASRAEVKAIRDVLEHTYGVYPSQQMKHRESVVAERRATYGAVQRLFGVRRLESLEDAESVGVRPLWGRLLGLSLEGPKDALDRLAARALSYGVREDRVEL